MNKKGSLMSWFFAMVLILFVMVAYFAFTQPFRFVDEKFSDQINFTKSETQTAKAHQVINKVRLYWVTWPLIIIAFLIIWAFFNSLKRDPNHPYL